MPTLDFDKLRAEKEVFDVYIGEERIVFPKQVAANIVLDLRRKSLKIPETDEAAQHDFFLEMGEALMPSDTFERLHVALGLSELFQVIDRLCVYYGIHDEEESKAEGKTEPAETPETDEAAEPETSEGSESPISSSITVPSRPTSNVFGLVPTTSYEPESSTGDVSSAG